MREVGNCASVVENGTSVAYAFNRLNRYTAEGSFCPGGDADGNRTLIRTSTDIWNVTCNAKNRPIRFEKADGSIVVECTYKAPEGLEGDWTNTQCLPRRGECPMRWARINTMGRRATKKVTTNGTLTEHRRYLYRGYLQISCCDLTRTETPALWHILWDPTQETATRPLAIQKNGTWYSAPARLALQGSRSQVCSRLGVRLLKPHPAYGWDLTKNICETYRTDGRIDLAYTYTPYGEVSPAHAYDQPIRWSSECHDTELGLVYYNYHHSRCKTSSVLRYEELRCKIRMVQCRKCCVWF